MQLLFLLVLEGLCHDPHAIIADSVAAKIKLADSLTVLQDVLQLIKTVEADIIFLECEHLQVSLFSKSTPQSQCTLGEDTVARQPDFSDVLGVLEHLSDMPCAVWPNKVVREVELTQRRVLLNGLTDGDASSHHGAVVSEVENEQVALVT